MPAKQTTTSTKQTIQDLLAENGILRDHVEKMEAELRHRNEKARAECQVSDDLRAKRFQIDRLSALQDRVARLERIHEAGFRTALNDKLDRAAHQENSCSSPSEHPFR